MTVAVIIVTRDNPVLLNHALSKYQEHPPGVDCDFHILDAESTSDRQKDLLVNQTLGHAISVPNDRVEVNFDRGWRRFPGYDYYFFCHDDNVPIRDDWLAPFVRRFEGHGFDVTAPPEYAHLPVGRVGALTQFWRSYTNVAGFPVACQWLKPCIEAVTNEEAPTMFRYSDCDRVLVSKECLEATNGLTTLTSWSYKRQELQNIFDTHLNYGDEGMYPKSKYPPGGYWNRFTLLSEFMNSVLPLMHGYRTVGVNHDGFLEQIHGEDVPWGHANIAHYGAPNAVSALAKHFGTDAATVKSRLNDPVLLVRAYNYFRSYYT